MVITKIKNYEPLKIVKILKSYVKKDKDKKKGKVIDIYL